MDNNTRNKINFTHLHVHSEFSMLDGLSRVEELVKRAKDLGMDSIALTDHGVMHGVVDFYKLAKKEGIHPVIGCEVYYTPHGRHKKEGKTDALNYHMILLAKNNEGYKNLMKLVSIAYIEGYYYKPRIDQDLLRKYSKGIIATSACLGGHIPQKLLNEGYPAARETAIFYKDIFEEGNFFLELQIHGYPEEEKVNEGLIRLSEELDIPLIVTNDSHYTYEEDVYPHDVLLCIQMNKKIHDKDRMRLTGGQFYIKSKEEMLENFSSLIDRYPKVLEAFENTHKIAHSCQVEIEFGHHKLPKYDVPEGYSGLEYFRELCNMGLRKRYPDNYKDHQARLDYEVDVIANMGFVDYFLVVWDFIKFAKDNDIAVGPGRGSAAGSIVAYSLEITNIDPIKYGLIFERFLNPERVTMPDIDIDFCYERRQEVIEYVNKKYGADKVAQIITFGTMAAKGAIRDVARAMDIPYAEADKVAKMIPDDLKMTINKALTMNPDLKKLYDESPKIKDLIDTAKRLEGITRHASTHAAGVVICDREVSDYVPLYASDGLITTQFPMGTLEELGLLKMDFLGLRTLTVIRDTLDEIKRSRGIKIDLDRLDIEDKKVYDLISSGKTEGLFQLESSGMKAFMQSLKPSNLEDILAGISLYRPGPMNSIPAYVEGRHYPEKVKYLTKELEPILSNTYGCIVYQEQVMQIVRDLAGYTLGRSDLVRRAMSKKKTDVMEAERKNFIYGNEEEGIRGCINNGINEKVASQIFDDMYDFASYAFNKSHGAAYAIISFQTAFLKTYYPLEYMAALISSYIRQPNKITEYLHVIKDMGIDLVYPDVNLCYSKFSVNDDKIVFGLSAIKGIGLKVIDDMVLEREKNGPYLSLTDYCKRQETKNLNKRVIESLIKAGAFDSFGGNRRQYLNAYPAIIKQIQAEKRNTLDGQISLFDMGAKEEDNKDHLENLPDFSDEIKLAAEKEVTGIYLSGHPLDTYIEILKILTSHNALDYSRQGLGDLEEDDDLTTYQVDHSKLYDRSKSVVGGLIVSVDKIYTKKGDMMCFLTLEDLYGELEIVVFPNIFEKNKDILVEGEKILVRGYASIQEGQDIKLIADEITSLDEEYKIYKNMPKLGEKRGAKEGKNSGLKDEKQAKKCLWLAFKDILSYENMKDRLLETLKNNQGTEDLMIYIKDAKKVMKFGKGVSIDEELKSKLKDLLGDENIKIQVNK